jgi:DNA-binding NarL/FixJ family response regulator
VAQVSLRIRLIYHILEYCAHLGILSALFAIALSMHAAEDQWVKMQSAGAVAYLSKTGNSDEIISTIRQQCAPLDP